MKRIKTCILIAAGVAFLALASCDISDDFVDPIDLNMQFNDDLQEIADYLADRGITDVDTTESSVRFAVLDPGDGDTVQLNDFVEIDYFATFTNGSGIVSSIQNVVDTAANVNNVSPILRFTHTASGWAFSQAAVISFDGLKEGITALLNQENPRLLVGGHGLIAVPRRAIVNTSPSGFPSPVQGFPNDVLIYEFFVENIRE